MFDQRAAAPLVWRARPEVSETPVACATELITPNDRFYRRDHLPDVPAVDGRWHIIVSADGRDLLTVDAAQLGRLPRLDATAVLECAGNGGSGGHLKRGGFGVARWTGAAFASLLDGLELDPGWRFATFTGRDRGRDPDEPDGTETYQRSIPLDVALDRALLATHMNDQPLPPGHGCPAGLVVPGWYGADWIKWVDTIELCARPSANVYMSRRYRRYQDEHGRSYGPMVRQLAVKSMIGSPVADQLCHGGTVAVTGLAWTGAAAIERVEIRVDGGAWSPAEVLDAADDRAVVCWQGEVSGLRPGMHVLASRAADSSGAVQPETPHGRLYEANHVLATPFYSI